MMKRALCVLLFLGLVAGLAFAAPETDKPALEPLLRVVDLRVGQQATVELCDGSKARVKLLDLVEKRDSLRNAVRQGVVTVEVNGQKVTFISATYHLPITLGDVQIDCALTEGCLENGDHWGLDADARFRLWPAGSPWIRPGTFTYPVNQKWFASGTLMANEIGDDERPADKSIYYHWGLDMGGAEKLVSVVAATDGVVVSARGEVLPPGGLPSPVHPRYDVVYVRDGRGWYYRYSHLDSIDASIQPGVRVKQGDKIGVLGKEGASGGWSHLHFDIVTPQPSGRWGICEGYAFLWQAYHEEHPTPLEAVARPHQLVWTDEPVTLDGTRSWCAKGKEHIARYEWMLTDGGRKGRSSSGGTAGRVLRTKELRPSFVATARGPTVERRYARAGTYHEILKITDDEGHVDYDFTLIQVVDRDAPDQQAPRVHAAYWPTFGIKPGDEVTFKVRSFRIEPDEGHETWDFGDGSPAITTQSPGNADAHDPNGYAITTHRYERPGDYIVSVHRLNRRDEIGMDHLHVRVEPR